MSDDLACRRVADRAAQSEEAWLRITDVEQRTGLSVSTIYRMVAVNAFPRPRRIGRVAAAWLQSELTERMRSRPIADPADIRAPKRRPRVA